MLGRRFTIHPAADRSPPQTTINEALLQKMRHSHQEENPIENNDGPLRNCFIQGTVLRCVLQNTPPAVNERSHDVSSNADVWINAVSSYNVRLYSQSINQIEHASYNIVNVLH